MPKLDPNEIVPPETLVESFHHPEAGWLDFDPRTNVIRQPIGRKPITRPISMTGQFIGTAQPHIPTCSYPEPGKNAGCEKAPECPVMRYIQQIRPGMDRPHIGPGPVIAKNRGAVSAMRCHDFFSVHDGRGRLLKQTNYSEQGWKLDTTRTTIPVRSANPQFNAMGQKTHTAPADWEMDVPGLLPYWWHLMKKQGKPLPEAAERFPEILEGDEEEECTTPPSLPQLPQSSLPDGVKKQTRKARGSRKGTGSRNARLAVQSGVTPAQDA